MNLLSKLNQEELKDSAQRFLLEHQKRRQNNLKYEPYEGVAYRFARGIIMLCFKLNQRGQINEDKS